MSRREGRNCDMDDDDVDGQRKTSEVVGHSALMMI